MMFINVNKTVLATAMLMSLSSLAHAADPKDQGHGKVSFSGSIVDSPCSISPDSVDQTVDLGQVSNVTLAKGGKSSVRHFAINLEGCSFASQGEGESKVVANNKVTVTFTGAESAVQKGKLGIIGSAKGAAIALAETDGDLITLGKPTRAQELQNGNNTLRFGAYLQGSDATIVPGDFSAVTNFTLAYN